MAKQGLWIKMRCDLVDDVAVINIAQELGIPESHVVGLLHKFWSWVKRQTESGNARGVTEAWLDRYLGNDGFAKALVDQGWLTVTEAGISMPNFDAHLSRNATDRAVTAERVAKHKRKKGNATSVTVSGSGSDSNSGSKNKKRKKDYTPEFEAFWDIYPKGQAKADSFAAWTTALKDGTAGTVPELIELVGRYLALPQIVAKIAECDVKHIAGLAPVIRNKRWEDKPDATAPTGRVLPKPGKYADVKVIHG